MPELFVVKDTCIPPMQLKYMLMTFSLLICFDGFFKGIFAQIESDINLRRFMSGGEEAWRFTELDSFLDVIKRLF